MAVIFPVTSLALKHEPSREKVFYQYNVEKINLSLLYKLYINCFLGATPFTFEFVHGSNRTSGKQCSALIGRLPKND